ncbi:MAG: SDR family oxidoreductase [Candidatus Binatia bacterium]
MLQESDTTILVTGATGFIGRHLVPRLLVAGRRVVVLARRRAGLSADARLAEIFGEISNRVEVVEGDLAYPTSLEKNLTRLRSTVHTVIHCAGETSFSAGERDSIRMIQIDGPLALLRMLAARGLRRWSHVSTAFVCGRRSGPVSENETDVGQEFHNSYERLKLQSEIAFKLACRELEVDLLILRPSIVVGPAPATMGGAPSNLLLAFLRMLVDLAHIAASRDTLVRIHGSPHARFNIVPVEYVVSAIAQLTEDTEAAGGTFHLVAANPPTQNAVAELVSARLGLRGLRVLEPREELSDPSPLESRLEKMLHPYKEYLEQDVQFDYSAARALVDRQGLHAPVIDDKGINRLIELAGCSSYSCRFS